MNSDYLAKPPQYPELSTLVAGISVKAWESGISALVVPYLTEVWLGHYDLAASGGEVVEVNVERFYYLFDLGPNRLIAAWGISGGRFAGERDKYRMEKYPQELGSSFQKGHAISHRLGGGTDINLTAQLGTVNMGPFQVLERRAVKSPGSLYFTYWMYGTNAESIVARRVQQGLLSSGAQPDIRMFDNY